MPRDEHCVITKPERRNRNDRRARPTPAIGVYCFRGRRRHARRSVEAQADYYVDIPHHSTLAAGIVLFTLGILDGWITLRLIEGGANEVNPLMDFFISKGVKTFFVAKLGITGLALIVLLMHENFAVLYPRIRVKWIILVCLCGYLALLGYELELLFGRTLIVPG